MIRYIDQVSDGQIDDSLVLIAFDEIIDEICVEDCLENTCYKRNCDQLLPLVDPI